jgi:aspartyl-tRNA(Asn)/glutamyl-tRNA(Gln) amidotransferase subunit A
MTLDLLPEARAAVSTVLAAEAAAFHRDRLHEHPDWGGADVRERLVGGQAVAAVEYLRALEIRRTFQHEIDRAFARVDVFVSPMLPVGAPPVGATVVPINDGTIDVLRATTANTREWNFVGLPAVSVPCGFTSTGLPIGMQIVGRAFAESTILRVGRACEREMAGGRRVPPL